MDNPLSGTISYVWNQNYSVCKCRRYSPGVTPKTLLNALIKADVFW
ncbi:hypothetical protein EVA_06779 [gut metagenome]|uniref:Uncharacterized protein n=1 Tax=gut metagenome TaxID=749906 RepID=J9GDZ3_9ZZZZ